MSRAKQKAHQSPTYFCYLLRCSDGSLYAGVTDNPTRPLQEHNSGKAAKYTFSRRPVEMGWIEKHNSLSAALRREIRLKKWNRSKKEALIAGSPRPRP